ncbi:MAG: indole-3-glycerol phosphate synthase TrpC [Phycisphaeraceae bacterium]|nr:indole-3-glycerol phosphate synthase TrpC [Phycisphaeraceae bacterium]
MSNVLEQIVADKRQEVARRRAQQPLEELKRLASDSPAPRNFFAALTRPNGKLRVIAEIKRASPSAGLIRPDFDPVAIAHAYADNGAAAISCLTDEKYFQGSLDYLAAVKQAVNLPVLRKDFIIDPYQVYESRAAGADAILLIAECLTEPRMLDLLILATELKLTTLIEVHDLESLVQVNDHVGFPHPTYQLLGINNRNLKTMTTDLHHTIDLLPHVQNVNILVSESGIRTHQDIELLAKHNVHRVLVGEHLMRQPDPGVALRQLIGG